MKIQNSENCVTKINALFIYLVTYIVYLLTRVHEETADTYRMTIGFPFQAENLRDKNSKALRVKKNCMRSKNKVAAVGVIMESYSGFVWGCKSEENVRMDSLFRQYTRLIRVRSFRAFKRYSVRTPRRGEC